MVAHTERRDERPHAHRAIEQRIRCATVACHRWGRRLGQSTTAIATALGLSARTVRQWTTHRDAATRRGRPTRPVDRGEARLMRLALLVHGPFVGTATLHAWCPSISRRAITQWRVRERQRQRRTQHVLRWTRPGRVWAMDVSDPPRPIDGCYRAIVHVRDLASQQYLAALPVVRATAAAVCDLLRALCATYDAPIALKVDNGSAFSSHALQTWAVRARTYVLYSPPACPRYNGGIEASIGALAAHAHEAAAAAGHPEYWTCDDVEAARTAANVRARGAATPITAAERRRFAVCYRAALRAGDRHAPTRVQQRTAIVQTLQRLGYVSITRRANLVH